MKKAALFLVSYLLLIFNLTGCGSALPGPSSAAPQQAGSSDPDVHSESPVSSPSASVQQESAPASQEAVPEAAVDPRSSEGILCSFCQAVLGQENAEAASGSVIHKWTGPVLVFSDPGPKDDNPAIPAEIVTELRGIPGFPEIRQADSAEEANLRFHFCTRAELFAAVGESISYEESNGAVVLTYDEDGSICSSDVWIRSDLSQPVQENLVVRSTVKSLGIPFTSELWPESAFYSSGSSQQLSELDRILLDILYDEQIICGMDAEDCADVIFSRYSQEGTWTH